MRCVKLFWGFIHSLIARPFLSNSQSLTDCSKNSRQPSHDLVYACEPNILHTALILPTFLGCHYSHVLRHLSNATWLACQHSNRWNKNGIGHSMKNFSLPCAKTSLETRLKAFYIMASSTNRYKIVASTYIAYAHPKVYTRTLGLVEGVKFMGHS